MNSRMIMPIIIGMYVTFTIGAMSLSPIVAAEESDDIPTKAQNTGEHDSLVAALTHANLVTALQAEGPFTVFAPTDAAFAAAGIDLASFDTDEENATLVDILTYHVYSGSVESSAVTDGLTVTMLNGDEATFTVADGAVRIGDATVTTPDVVASNGIIHVIDKVLLPPADVTAEDGDVCYNLHTHTISAGASFEECVAYAYYVDYEMNGQTFTGCYNMVTHALTMVSQEECESYVWTPAVDIAMTAQATTIHGSLVAALAHANLVTALQAEGPFTVFAPTDAAFAAAGIDLATFDTDEENATLVDILTYHVYSGSVESSAVTDGLTVTMLNGDEATFTVADGSVSIGDATVALADVPASNGVIHVIDKVLMPPADEPTIPEGCDYVIGIDDTGLAYDNIDLAIEVGQTVCWIWEDESMAHNLAEISEEGDTSRMIGGEYSGESMTTVDYRLTFTEDETFHYICEPHATMGMAGKVTVGSGVQEVTTPEPVYEEENNTPGFTAMVLGVAAISAVVLSGRRRW